MTETQHVTTARLRGELDVATLKTVFGVNLLLHIKMMCK